MLISLLAAVGTPSEIKRGVKGEKEHRERWNQRKECKEKEHRERWRKCKEREYRETLVPKEAA